MPFHPRRPSKRRNCRLTSTPITKHQAPKPVQPRWSCWTCSILPSPTSSAREQLISFIKKNPAASEMALCTLASNLRLIPAFTHDENALIAAVNGKKGGVKAPPWQSDSGMERSVQFTRDAVAVGAGTVEQLQRTQLTLDAQN